MSGELPEIFWFLFWVGVLAFVAIFSVAMMALLHRRTMKALALLKVYAEKGIEPPRALAELLAASGRAHSCAHGPRGAAREPVSGLPSAVPLRRETA